MSRTRPEHPSTDAREARTASSSEPRPVPVIEVPQTITEVPQTVRSQRSKRRSRTKHRAKYALAVFSAVAAAVAAVVVTDLRNVVADAVHTEMALDLSVDAVPEAYADEEANFVVRVTNTGDDIEDLTVGAASSRCPGVALGGGDTKTVECRLPVAEVDRDGLKAYVGDDPIAAVSGTVVEILPTPCPPIVLAPVPDAGLDVAAFVDRWNQAVASTGTSGTEPAACPALGSAWRIEAPAGGRPVAKVGGSSSLRWEVDADDIVTTVVLTVATGTSEGDDRHLADLQRVLATAMGADRDQRTDLGRSWTGDCETLPFAALRNDATTFVAERCPG